MNKAYKIIHRMVTISSWGMLLMSLVYLFIRWNNLPEPLGVHFSATGEFDLYDDKVNAFYPYIVGFGVLIFCEFITWVAGKVKSGLKVNEQGELYLRMAAVLWIDLVKGGITLFFIHWSLWVIHQKPMNTDFVVGIIYTIGIGFLLLPVVVVAIRIFMPRKK